MAKVPKNAKQGRPRKSAARSGTAHLDNLIAEATVDCYNESEEITGIFTMLQKETDCGTFLQLDDSKPFRKMVKLITRRIAENFLATTTGSAMN